MKKTNNLQRSEESLDPYDWEELKKFGNDMVHDMIGLLQNIKQQPVWRKPTKDVKSNFGKKLPRSPKHLGEVYEDFKQNILPYYTG